jgi:uncharacterized protein YndB with AHSA1/START domain
MNRQEPKHESNLGLELIVEHLLPASRERVFRAWSDAALMLKWFAPLGMQAIEADIDLRVGGKFHIAMQERDGTIHRASGRYLEIVPPERLVFTWAWIIEPEKNDESAMTVTLEFFERGTATHVVLTHERLPNEAIKTQHREGWGGCLDQLAIRLADNEV